MKKEIKWIVLSCFGGLVVLSMIAMFGLYYLILPEKAPVLPATNVGNASGIVNIRDFDLWYKMIGTRDDALPVLVIHGGPGLGSEYIHEGLDFLGDSRCVYYFDRRGTGYSESKADCKLYTMDEFVLDMEAFRSEIIEKDKIILVAHSYGCLLALNYAIHYQERVDRMVLMSSSSIKLDMMENLKFFGDILSHGFPPKDPLKANIWMTSAICDIHEDAYYDKDTEIEYYFSYATMLSVLYSMLPYDYSNDLKHLDIPALVISGGSEFFTSKTEYQREIAELLPRSRFMKIDNSGHCLFADTDDVIFFRSELLAFLKE